MLRSLPRIGVIEKTGWSSYESRTQSHNDRQQYAVADWVPGEVEEILGTRDAICPCGHSGVSNCGDHFECTFELWDQEFDRGKLEVDD